MDTGEGRSQPGPPRLSDSEPEASPPPPPSRRGAGEPPVPREPPRAPCPGSRPVPPVPRMVVPGVLDGAQLLLGSSRKL